MSIEREGDWLVWNPTGNFVRRFSLNNLLAVDTRAASLSRMEQFFSMRKATSRIAEGAFRIEAELVYFEELADEPVVPGGEDAFEPAPVEFMASKTDVPRGPIVIRTRSPSLVLACTPNDSATTLTSVKPALVRSCFILFAAARFWLELANRPRVAKP